MVKSGHRRVYRVHACSAKTSKNPGAGPERIPNAPRGEREKWQACVALQSTLVSSLAQDFGDQGLPKYITAQPQNSHFQKQ